jgi:PTS system nitrogen regulatory IIA component
MNRLSQILPSAQVLVAVDAASKKRAFEDAGLLFENLHGLNRSLVTDSLFARERLGSTGLGHGVAIPHGRIKGLKLVPEAATQKHLEILSEIAEMLSDSNLRENLKLSQDAGALHQLIASWLSSQVSN